MKINKILIILMVFLLSAGTIFGAITSNRPSTAGTTVYGTYVFNATTTLANARNCTWGTTQNASFGTTANTTASQTVFTKSVNTATLVDAEDTTLTITCKNTSTTQTATVVINVDNTAPVCSFSVNLEDTEVLDIIGIDTTQASTDTTDLTYSWSVYDPSGAVKTTSTSANPTFSSTDFDMIGFFKIGLTVTDEASHSTACTNQTINVNSADDSSDALAISLVDKVSDDRTGNKHIMIILMIVMLLLFGLAGLFAISLSKKGKKRR